MTSLLLLALASPLQEPAPKPSALLGMMIARYAEARSLSGKVLWRQVATAPQGRAEQTVTTEFALARPSRLRVAQKSSKYPQKTFLFTSDGNEFAFDVPDLQAPGGLRLVEPVMKPEGPHDIGRLLQAARRSIPDMYSPFLSVAGGAMWDLRNLQGSWVSLEDGGVGEVNGIACRIVKGKWRQAATQGATGTFGVWITTEGDLLKYSTEESLEFNDENKKPLGKATIVSEWTGSIAVNPTLPDGTFTLIR